MEATYAIATVGTTQALETISADTIEDAISEAQDLCDEDEELDLIQRRDGEIIQVVTVSRTSHGSYYVL